LEAGAWLLILPEAASKVTAAFRKYLVRNVARESRVVSEDGVLCHRFPRPHLLMSRAQLGDERRFFTTGTAGASSFRSREARTRSELISD
jgi:hypothetical protein